MIASGEAQLSALSGSPTNANNITYAASQQLQITIDDLESKLDRGSALSPFDAVIWEGYCAPGSYITEYQPVVKIYKPSDMKIEVQLLTQDALAIHDGMKASCELADGEVIDASVDFISPVAEETLSSIGMKESRSTVRLTRQPFRPRWARGIR